jgi:hypothetical protein
MDIVGINPHPERSAIIAKSRFQPDRQKKQRHRRIGVAGIEPKNAAAERVAHLVIELRELRDSLTPRRRDSFLFGPQLFRAGRIA